MERLLINHAPLLDLELFLCSCYNIVIFGHDKCNRKVIEYPL